MNNSNRIADFIRRFPGRDDDEISAALQIKPRQTVNQVCRTLAKSGTVERRPNPTGKLGNYPLCSGPINPAAPSGGAEVLRAGSAPGATEEWFWEGNVTDVVVEHLAGQGWRILSRADIRTKERGLDLHAMRDNHEIVVEVKGYPSQSYRDPNRADQQKPTNPASQAQQWYSHAILKAMRLQSAYPSAVIVVAFPDFRRYRTLFKETECAIRKLGIAVLFVSEARQVEAIGL